MIDHVFVLMLENRSFDHMLGTSRLTGRDAVTGEPTELNGLTGNETNVAESVEIPVTSPADYALAIDPKHGFDNVVEQLCGSAATFTRGNAYPKIDNSGFAASCVTGCRVHADRDVPTMRAFEAARQLPVLTYLASNFVVCDNWFSSMPGPTWPNRFFAHAASSAGLDEGPSALRATAAVFRGYQFKNGTVFDRLDGQGRGWCVVEGGGLPVTLAMEGMLPKVMSGSFVTMDEFRERMAHGNHAVAYTFIEPHYGHILLSGRNFKCGNSQHPMDDVTRGEALIKDVYEIIRGSEYWNSSLLMILYDEHGGFFDHVQPPPAVPPGDELVDASTNTKGFAFDRLGVRTPAVIVSPRTGAGLIDHTLYDHTSLIATLSRLFDLGHLTERDRAANPLNHLISDAVRDDKEIPPAPSPAQSGIQDCEGSLAHRLAGELENMPAEWSEQTLEESLVGFMHVAMLRDAHLAAIEGSDLMEAIENKIGDAGRFLEHVLSAEPAAAKFEVAKFTRGVERRYEHWRGKALT